MRTIISCLAFALVFTLLLLAQPDSVFAQNQPGQEKEKKQRVEEEDDDDDDCVSEEERKAVKLTLEEARAIALAEVDGKVIDEELEKEHGRLQYAFDIKKSDGRIFDVEIDAITGKVLQALEDDEDDDDDDKPQAKQTRANKPVERTAKTVKRKPNK